MEITHMNALDYLHRPDAIWKTYAHDRVEISGHASDGSPVRASLLGVCYSEYESGPNLWELAQAAACIFGPGSYGLVSCRLLGRGLTACTP